VSGAGSDDGRVWIYAADSGRPVATLAADQDVVNAVQVGTPRCCRTPALARRAPRLTASWLRLTALTQRPHCQAHPSLPVLATSGIERTVKLWSPGDEQAADARSLMQTMKDNQVCPACVNPRTPLTWHALPGAPAACVAVPPGPSSVAACDDASPCAKQERMSEGPPLGIHPSVLMRLSERPELLNLLLAHAARGESEGAEGEEGRPAVACRMA